MLGKAKMARGLRVGIDIQPILGPKWCFANIKMCLLVVRSTWPKAQIEGLPGTQRSFRNGGEIVGYAWPVRGTEEDMWLRVKPAT